LDPGKTYYVKAKAFHGDFTESGFGPTGSASTVDPQLTFDIDIHANDQDTGGPYILDIGTLLAGNVVTAPDKIWLDLETNAESGGSVFAASQNNGLLSNSASYTIPGVNGNLDSLSEGFGFRGNTASQDSGGPFVISTDFNKSGNNVSQIPQTFVTVFETAAPVVGGRGSLLVKAKSSSQTPAKNDYREVLTFIGAANF